MKKIKKPLQPKLPKNLLTDNTYQLDTEEIMTGYLIDDGIFSEQVISHASIQSCQINKGGFSNGELHQFDVQDTIFDHCDFSNTEMYGGSFHRVIFKNCKLTGANFAESVIKDCQFQDCLMDFSTFSYGNLKIVEFIDCSLKESDFFEVRWQHLSVEQTNLTGSNWFNTELADLNLASCQFEKIGLSPEHLRGLIVNQEQALVIALNFGIIIDNA